MAAKIIKLVAPNNLPIVGIRLEDGTVCEVAYTYDDVRLVGILEVDKTGGAKTSNRNGDGVLVDSAGNEWPASDIEYYSILRS